VEETASLYTSQRDVDLFTAMTELNAISNKRVA